MSTDILWFARESFKDLQLEMSELLRYATRDQYRHFFENVPSVTSADSSVIFGETGFIFVNDGSNRWREQLMGTHPDCEQAAKQQLELISRRKETFERQGRVYHHLIVPEKDIVYPHLSPNVPGAQVSLNRVAKLLQQKLDRRLLTYPEATLAAVRQYGHVFHARNSHLNFFGGYFVVQEMLRNLGRTLPPIEEICFEYHAWPDDLSLKFVDNLNTSRRILKGYGKEHVISSPEGHVGKHLVFRNENAIYNDSVVVFGDSYSWNPDAGVARFLSLVFRTVNFFWNQGINHAQVEQCGANFVLCESAERFLIKTPKDI